MSGLTKALRCWPWLAAICTGILCAGCFAPFNHAWFCWIALTPLLAAIWFSGENTRRRGLRDFFLGYVAGLPFFWIVFFWLRTVTVPGWFLVAPYMALYFAFWSWFCGVLRPSLRKERLAEPGTRWTEAPPNESPLSRSPWLRSTNNLRLAFLLAAIWVTQETLRSVVFSGWGWNTLGSALHAHWPLIQIVEFTGVAGLSFLVAFSNVIILSSIRRFILETRVRPVRAHFDLTLTMAAIVGVIGYGVHALQIQRSTKPLRVALVQANIPREEKFSREYAHKIFDQFARLSGPSVQTNPPVDLLVWPESSMPGPVLEDEESYRFVMDFSASAKTDLLLGTIEVDEKEAYNAALLVSDGGKTTQLYKKVHLVPFGEYVPGRHFIPFISEVVGNQVPSDFAFGKEHTVFQMTKQGARVAPLICFEDTIGELTRQFVLGGADLLVNVTNDGWFQRSAGSRQHLANAVFRCVETRRPMVRAANTGITCFINEFGRITQTLVDETGSQFTDGVLSGEVGISTERELTFYTRYGELFAYCCAAITILTLFYTVLFTKQKQVGLRSAESGRS
ncbi:MAG: apolipoprotein N-acyltransferase [Chthoniobacterales bacterium]